jgi:hypothetical protein
MACFFCMGNSFRSISTAMAKAASSKLRQIGAAKTAVNWTMRAEICERCPLRVVRRGVSYCGTPFLQKIDRDPVIDGCGCPTRDKAQAPEEHCPLPASFHAPVVEGRCGCKWCAIDGSNPWASNFAGSNPVKGPG